jgi:transcriptional regulator with XRE-family HTH domain
MRAYGHASRQESWHVKTIRELREAMGWTQLQLAVQIGVTPGSVYAWENGRKTPLVAHLQALADAFGVRMDEIKLTTIQGQKRTAA